MHAKHIFVGENFHEKLEAPRKIFCGFNFRGRILYLDHANDIM